MVAWFPAPASATGEDLAEFHLHGGRAVIAAMLEALSSLEGFRPAEAGEFSRRAFDNGKLDLTEIEGLADLIAAETEAQRRQALSQLEGRFGAAVENWRRSVIELRARVEAGLDFADEEDVPDDLASGLRDGIDALRFAIETTLEDGGRGERIRDGIQVAVMGPPNAGKSSLMNAIARRDVAIVTEEAGTTRDVIEVHLDLDGYPMTIADTAGLREAEGVIESEGIKRALARGRTSDLVLWVTDSTVPEGDIPAGVVNADRPVWQIGNKTDLLDSPPKQSPIDGLFAISVKTGSGIAALTEALSAFAQRHCGSGADGLITRERHRLALQDCVLALGRASTMIDSEPELLAEELRVSGDALGRIVGRIDVEELLDVIFAEFCIGK